MEHLDSPGPEGQRPSASTWVLILLAATTLCLGIWGFTRYAPEAGCAQPQPAYFLDWLYRSLALFEISEVNIRLSECYPHRSLALARFTGIAALILAAARVVTEVFRDPLDRWHLSRSRNHAVVIGFGEIGQVRAIEFASHGTRTVAVDQSANDVLRDIARRNGILLVRGDARVPNVLLQARIQYASDVTVALGDDTRNLAVGQFLAKSDDVHGRRIEVSMTSPLIRRALDGAGSAGPLDMFSVEEMAAAQLCQAARFYEIADLLGQHRLHIVLVGSAPIAFIIAAHILRTCAMADFAMPRLTFLAADPDGVRDQLLLASPGIEDIADLAFLACDPLLRPFDHDDLMRKVAEPAPVTAVLVAAAEMSANLPIALAVREAIRRNGWWLAPVFFGTDRVTTFPAIGHDIASTRRFSDVLHPFEASADLIRRGAMGERDRIARAIHESYCETFPRLVAEGQQPSQGGDALGPWEKVAHTYRQANRRVADHLPAKLASAGCFVPRDTLGAGIGFDLLVQPDMLDRLAELEHQAWVTDRLLEGWRYHPVRDNARRLHDCLVPYSQLPRATQELDRVQIRDLNLVRLPRVKVQNKPDASLVRFDLWIGLIGARTLTQDRVDWVKSTLETVVLPDLLAAHPDHTITLLSSLAPGGDLVLTQTALGLLAEQHRQHRLLVTEAFADRRVIEDFETSWRAEGVGSLDRSTRKPTWVETRSALLATIQRLEADPRCERILELHAAPSSFAEPPGLGYRLQNAYLVQRAHVIVAVVSDPPDLRPGGVDEAMMWRRDQSAIPKTLPHYFARPNAPAAGSPGLVVLDASQRTVTRETPV